MCSVGAWTDDDDDDERRRRLLEAECADDGAIAAALRHEVRMLCVV